MTNRRPRIKYTTLAREVRRHIIEDILEGRLKAGQKLVSADIAKEFGVSPTPVREACLALEKEGFVYSVPRSGKYVRGYTAKELKEIYAIREVLEGLAARWAARSGDPDLLETMRNTCENYKLGIEEGNVDLCDESELLFHETLAKMSGCKRLIDMIQEFHIQSISLGKRGAHYWDYAPVYLKEHLSIFDAVSQKRSDLAEKRARDHVRRGTERTF